MSKWDKLIKKITSLDKNMRFLELKKVLESMGYVGVKPGSGSSHWTFRKEGYMPITVPEHEPIKVIYVKKVKEVIEKYRGD